MKSSAMSNTVRSLFVLASVLGCVAVARSTRKEKKWLNVKVVNQVGTKVRLTTNRVLPKSILSSGEIFVYHRLLSKSDQRASIMLRAVDAYNDKPLMLNGKFQFHVKPVAFDGTQEAYVTRLGKSNKWFYVKFINNAGVRVKLTPNQILPSTNLGVDEVQVNYAQLEPGDELKRIILRAADLNTHDPLKLNGEYTLAMRPDDSGNVARVKVTQGDTINARCDHFVSWSGTISGSHEYQIVTDDAKNWFDAFRACKLCHSDLLSVHSPEENGFVTQQLRRSADIHKLWIGMTYREKARMWSWSDDSRYRYQNWKEGQHYDGTDEQCGMVYQQYDWGRWDDDNCYKPMGFVCKRRRTKSRQIDVPALKKDMVSRPENIGCSSESPVCPSLCKVVQLSDACLKCDCSSLAIVQDYGGLSRKDQNAVHELLTEPRLQTNEPSENDQINPPNGMFSEAPIPPSAYALEMLTSNPDSSKSSAKQREYMSVPQRTARFTKHGRQQQQQQQQQQQLYSH